MIIGFTGTRLGLTDAQKETLSALFVELKPKMLHHGDCIGADKQAHEMAAFIGIMTVAHPCNLEQYRAHCKADIVLPALAPLVRDKVIVETVHGMIACPATNAESRSGTWSTIRHALRMGVPVTIVLPDGKTVIFTGRN